MTIAIDDDECLADSGLRFLVNYVVERPWQPIQSPTKGRKKRKAKSCERNQITFTDLRFEKWQL